MSEEPEISLASRLQQALEDHIAATGGGMVLAWHLVAEIVEPDGGDGWLFSTMDRQTQIKTMGLVKWALGIAEYEQGKFLEQLSGE